MNEIINEWIVMVVSGKSESALNSSRRANNNHYKQMNFTTPSELIMTSN